MQVFPLRSNLKRDHVRLSFIIRTGYPISLGDVSVVNTYGNYERKKVPLN